MNAPRLPPQPAAPDIRRRRWSANLIWLVPIAAALVGLSMVVHTWRSQGPTIDISFQTAEGLEAGKTQVKYKDVVIGLVGAITLAEDRSHIVVQVKLDHDARSFASADSRFWVVRPRIGASGVSGIGTLLSGSYIAADTRGEPTPRKTFVGLELPPAVISGSLGRRFSLHARDIGSLDVGSPVYYRRVQVGRLISYALDADGDAMRAEVFVDAPYDRLVTAAARFWNASGVDLRLDASGLRLNTQSLATVIAGGIAFQPVPGSSDRSPSPEGSDFELFDDKESAMAPPNGEPTYLRMRFEQSLRGLNVGAPLDFHGVVVGKVVSIDLDYDPAQQSFPLIVGAVIYPLRFGRAHEKIVQQTPSDTPEARLAHLVKPLVARGLRAQARTGSLLTGQLYVALDFFPQASHVAFDDAERPIVLPTTSGSFDRLQEQLAGVVEKIDRIPFESIGRHLDKTLVTLDTAVERVDREVLPQFGATLSTAQGTLSAARQTLSDDSPLMGNADEALLELGRMAQSLRELAEGLDRHPESVLRGVPADDGSGQNPSAAKAGPHE